MKKTFKTLAYSLLVGLLFVSFGATAQVTVISTGQVGIGTSTPGVAKFKAVGSSQLEFTLDAAVGNPDFAFQEVGVTHAQIKYDITLGGLGFFVDKFNTGDAGLPVTKIGFYVEGTNMRRVGIGTTAPNASTKLDVKGAIGYNGTLINTSDKRLKTDVNKFGYGLNEVLQIDPITYSYTGEADTWDQGQHVGMMAQDMQEIAPELVSTFEHVEYDVDSAPFGEKAIQELGRTEYLAIHESAIKYMLINAVKEQQDVITNLEDKVAQLEELVKMAIENGSVGTTINSSEVTLEHTVVAELGQNRPNPFNGVTKVDYNIPTNAVNAEINIFNVEGKLMKTVTVAHTGIGVLTINASEIPAGTYSYQLVVDGQIVDAKKMVMAN